MSTVHVGDVISTIRGCICSIAYRTGQDRTGLDIILPEQGSLVEASSTPCCASF